MAALCSLPSVARAQREREWRAQAVGTVAPSARSFAGAGVGFILRTRTRVGAGLAGTLGARDGNLAGRGEALLSFSLDPLRERGVALYMTGGVAVVGDRVGAAGYAVAAVGLLGNPSRATGWFFEAGVGGGLRLAAGFAVRRRSIR